MDLALRIRSEKLIIDEKNSVAAIQERAARPDDECQRIPDAVSRLEAEIHATYNLALQAAAKIYQ